MKIHSGNLRCFAEATKQRHAMDVPGATFLGLSVLGFMRWMARKLVFDCWWIMMIMIACESTNVDEAICLHLLMGLMSHDVG